MSQAVQIPVADEAPVIRHVLRAAWLGVLLGLAIEALLLAVQFWQQVLPAPVAIAADTVQKLSWSSLVCAAIAAGQAAARGNPAVAGLFGLIGAPVAFLLARALHKATLSALGSDAAAAATQWLSAGIKGIEYALLGIAILWLARREAGWKMYAGLGAVIGAVTYALTSWWLPATGDPVQRAIVEVLHPVGCALAVYMTMRLGRHLGGRAAGDD